MQFGEIRSIIHSGENFDQINLVNAPKHYKQYVREHLTKEQIINSIIFSKDLEMAHEEEKLDAKIFGIPIKNIYADYYFKINAFNVGLLHINILRAARAFYCYEKTRNIHCEGGNIIWCNKFEEVVLEHFGNNFFSNQNIEAKWYRTIQSIDKRPNIALMFKTLVTNKNISVHEIFRRHQAILGDDSSDFEEFVKQTFFEYDENNFARLKDGLH